MQQPKYTDIRYLTDGEPIPTHSRCRERGTVGLPVVFVRYGGPSIGIGFF